MNLEQSYLTEMDDVLFYCRNPCQTPTFDGKKNHGVPVDFLVDQSIEVTRQLQLAIKDLAPSHRARPLLDKARLGQAVELWLNLELGLLN